MSDWGTGFVTLSALLSGLPSTPDPATSTHDAVLGYLRDNRLGGLKYEPGGDRTLSLEDMYYYCKSIGVKVEVCRWESSRDDGRVLEFSAAAVVCDETAEWSVASSADLVGGVPCFVQKFLGRCSGYLQQQEGDSATENAVGGDGLVTFVKLALLSSSELPPASTSTAPVNTTQESSCLAQYGAAASKCNVNKSAEMCDKAVTENGYDKQAHVYGDITLPGVASMLAALPREVAQDSTWIDLGSGSGLALLAMRLLGVKRLVGVELIQPLVELSRTILPAAESGGNGGGDDAVVALHAGDFLDGSVAWWSGHSTPLAVFCHCTVIFTQADMVRLKDVVVKNCPSGTVFVGIGIGLPGVEVWRECLVEVSWGVEVAVFQKLA
jgi:hypothetical protein